MYAIRSYYASFRPLAGPRRGMVLQTVGTPILWAGFTAGVIVLLLVVITSYSIHYTKLYEDADGREATIMGRSRPQGRPR